jgi:hypothetical protein
MPKFNNNPWGSSAISPAATSPYTLAPLTPSTGSFGPTTTNPWINTKPASPTGTSGGTGSAQGGQTTHDQLITRTSQVGTGQDNPAWFPNPGWAGTDLPLWHGDQIFKNEDGDTSGTIPDESLMTQRGGAGNLLQQLNLGLSGMRAAAARGSGVRSPFKQGGGAGGAATDLEKFDNQLLAMGSEYLGKNVAGFDQGGKYNMYNNGGSFYNKAQQMKAAIMDQAMQSGIVAAQLDNVRRANNNNATARDLVGRMRNFARGGRF